LKLFILNKKQTTNEIFHSINHDVDGIGEV